MGNLNTPEIRFPEFDGKWDSTTLGELCEFKNGINASKEQYGTGIKFINVLDILNNDFILYDNIIGSVEIDDATFQKNAVEFGDILFQRSSETREEVGTACVYLDKNKTATFGGFVIRGKKIGEYEPIFINNLLKTDTARKEITTKAGGSTRYNVGQEILKSVVITIPSILEQQKIASFFTAIDQKISQLKQKKTLLEQYKKGVMQKIFSQEPDEGGSRTPQKNKQSCEQIRFRGENGQEFPKWEKKKLGELLIESNDKTTESNQYKILSSTTKGIYNQDEYFKQDIASKNNTGYKILKINQLVFSPQNLWLGNINVNTEFEIGIVSPSYKIFSFNSEYTTVNFCKYFLTIPKMMFEYEQASEQGASVVRRNLSMYSFFGINIHLPSLSEQTKIANFLSAIDDKINRTQTQIDKAELWKKGLMQQMFV